MGDAVGWDGSSHVHDPAAGRHLVLAGVVAVDVIVDRVDDAQIQEELVQDLRHGEKRGKEGVMAAEETPSPNSMLSGISLPCLLGYNRTWRLLPMLETPVPEVPY